MQYFKISTGRFIQYDETTERSKIIIKADLQAEKQELQARIAEADPNQPTTNAQWVTWAKANYPYVDHSAEQTELNRINTILEAIREL
jgi:hypothetical protein